MASDPTLEASASRPRADRAPGGAVGPGGEDAIYRGPDRRKRPTPFLSRYSFWGGKRKSGGRRPGERVDVFVDLYSAPTLVLLTAFLALNLLDSHYTLLYLLRGGAEGNPFAQWLLEQGIQVFLLVKASGIGAAAILFCILKNFRNGQIGVVLALTMYQVLFLYHLMLYFNVYPGSVEP